MAPRSQAKLEAQACGGNTSVTGVANDIARIKAHCGPMTGIETGLIFW